MCCIVELISSSVPDKTAEYLQSVLNFGDWLILSMMADHLDIKIFTDILVQVRTVHVDQKRHSSISTTIDVIGASDTEGEAEAEEKEILKVVTPMVTPASARKAHPPIIKKVD